MALIRGARSYRSHVTEGSNPTLNRESIAIRAQTIVNDIDQTETGAAGRLAFGMQGNSRRDGW
jgi:hypothetical protein